MSETTAIPVKMTPIFDNGRRYEKLYSHPDKDILVRYMEGVKNSIEPMRSPSVSVPYYHNGVWNCNLNYYGLD